MAMACQLGIGAVQRRAPASCMPSQTSVVILGGGVGRRFGCLTSREAPKALLPVANSPLISYPVEWVAAAGLREATVVVGAPRSPPICDAGACTRAHERVALAHAVCCSQTPVLVPVSSLQLGTPPLARCSVG